MFHRKTPVILHGFLESCFGGFYSIPDMAKLLSHDFSEMLYYVLKKDKCHVRALSY